MKQLFTICICILLAQAGTAQKLPQTIKLPKAFLPVAEKIKRLNTSSSTPYKGVLPTNGATSKAMELSFTNYEAGNTILYLSAPASVLPDGAIFNAEDPKAKSASDLSLIITDFKGGTYFIEMNVAVNFKGTEQFNINTVKDGQNMGAQSIMIDNSKSIAFYEPQKLVFAVNLKPGKNFVIVSSKSGFWQFTNCQVTPVQ